jgi:hypothetical protein
MMTCQIITWTGCHLAGCKTHLQYADVLAVPELHLQRGHELPNLRLAHLHLCELHDSRRTVCEMPCPVQILNSLQLGPEGVHGVLSVTERPHTAWSVAIDATLHGALPFAAILTDAGACRYDM